MAPLSTRRELIQLLAAGIAAAVLPMPLAGSSRSSPSLHANPDEERLARWATALRQAGLVNRGVPRGRAAARVGELAAGTPYEANTLEAYLRDGGSPVGLEPLTLSLTRFDCVTLVESCLAVARAAGAPGEVSWERFGREVERMRYRGGVRGAYGSRLHYFSEWIRDGARRGLVRDLGQTLGGRPDRRPLRFMSTHRKAYPALANDAAFSEIEAMERRQDGLARHVVPTDRIARAAGHIQHGDVLAFATSIPGLDVTHAAMAYRHRDGRLGVLHAPLSGGVVEVARLELPAYVRAIRHATGILVARPLPG